MEAKQVSTNQAHFLLPVAQLVGPPLLSAIHLALLMCRIQAAPQPQVTCCALEIADQSLQHWSPLQAGHWMDSALQ